ncbi:biosynthetic arginine decarboxylase [Aliarcobacter skirrowii]|uniref:Arginine decarboxylase n=1 Tax=Aliarcobacter skirrowii CCUG 10374 TaxID=1032239 RepID=A0AAD0SKL7_9BACT|nr:biosynthetic arginine decarboxylase [Aliarcobacter skirrowii]AXX84454.1 arginine decarboxylase [Aliarcobacter skirrowii CCUG 10374]KAB0621373.1 biosynthetic arginine decarboxylase [Aliarcobacter skirrowii CCUG 10374]MDD3026043.1 biosynthetic arginine decarboxylase [Aliarcobacter skirrowii]NLN13957.1 biosynthetic arginine decarboxylase [Aliarcobacter skirrowii]RXI26629.1 biosynthetic arginine decarboxylase [Aliarcobacter skirrowii CCUG 10374]
MKNKFDYGIDIWGDGNFFVEDGVVKVNYKPYPSLISITKDIRKRGFRGPLLLRFPHITKKQIKTLFNAFNSSIKEYDYKGSFNAVFPLKVNQLPNFVHPLVSAGKKYGYGLEAGSKAELIIAMTYNNMGSPITVNGFKDKEMIHLCFIAKSMGHDITVIIEGLNELEMILEVLEESKMEAPNVGIRVRLHSGGSGVWAKSGGIDSKFGLTSTEILEAFELLQDNNLEDLLTMIHFHIGSAMNTIKPLKKALRESGHIYAELKNLGAKNLSSINIGGGLSVEYSAYEQSRFYSLNEFASDVVFTLKDIAKQKGVEEPNIFTESGRFISAASTVLIAPVLELFSAEYELVHLKLKEKNPPLIEELNDLLKDMTKKKAYEFMHDAMDHLESLLTLFDLGYIDLQDRSNAEVLTHQIIKKAISLLEVDDYEELRKFDKNIQEKYLLNFSLFQSLPDYWGINQEFPIMPITHLDKKPSRRASLWDITCDSDGEIPFDMQKPLYLHDVNLNKEDYFLGFFNVGAYQDTLGMKHNLFAHPTEVNVVFKDEEVILEKILESQKVLDILDDIDYDTEEIQTILSRRVPLETYEILKKYLNDNSYLKTIWSYYDE